MSASYVGSHLAGTSLIRNSIVEETSLFRASIPVLPGTLSGTLQVLCSVCRWVPIFLVSTLGEGEIFGFTVWVSISTFAGLHTRSC